MILRLLSDENAMLLLALTALACGVFLGVFDRLSAKTTVLMRLEKTTGIAALIYGTLLMVGFSGGSTDPWQPLGFLQGSGTQATNSVVTPSVRTVKTSAEYEQALSEAKTSGKPVMVDFTADWCVTC